MNKSIQKVADYRDNFGRIELRDRGAEAVNARVFDRSRVSSQKNPPFFGSGFLAKETNKQRPLRPFIHITLCAEHFE
jgi:ribosome biogenesis protein Nip4